MPRLHTGSTVCRIHVKLVMDGRIPVPSEAHSKAVTSVSVAMMGSTIATTHVKVDVECVTGGAECSPDG